MDEYSNTVVRDVAPSHGIFSALGTGSDTRETPRMARPGVAGRVESDSPCGLGDATGEQPADELKRLYATIADLRERLAAHGETSPLGAADVVLLRAMREPMTRRQLAAETRMSAGYLHVRLNRLRAMGYVHACGRLSRIGSGKGQGEWIWQKAG
jgi:hypothetical protein